MLADLIHKGTNVDLKDSDNNTPLLLAMETRNSSIINLLLDAGADVYKTAGNYSDNDCNDNYDDEDYSKKTVLYMAIKSNNMNILKLFINAINDVNAEDYNDNTLLHLTAERGNSNILKLLIDAGAYINKQKCDGVNPLLRAIKSKKTSMSLSFQLMLVLMSTPKTIKDALHYTWH